MCVQFSLERENVRKTLSSETRLDLTRRRGISLATARTRRKVDRMNASFLGEASIRADRRNRVGPRGLVAVIRRQLFGRRGSRA